MSGMTREDVEAIAREEARLAAERVQGQAREAGGGGYPEHNGPWLAEISQAENDYLLVQLLDKEGNTFGDGIRAAKPVMLRHDADLYPWPTSLVSTSANTVRVTRAGDSYDWIVTPDGFQAGHQVQVVPVAYSGVEFNGEDLKWMVTNCSLAWGTEDEPIEGGA